MIRRFSLAIAVVVDVIYKNLRRSGLSYAAVVGGGDSGTDSFLATRVFGLVGIGWVLAGLKTGV